ncbi:MAG: YcgL domain-containing protein [Gammaproteobacteria bacterium]|jgi:uncharacterized protein
MADNTLPCWIYKSARKEEMYLYLSAEDGYEELPEMLKQHFGKALFVMQLDLAPQRPLARADVGTVMQALREQGYYLQMPPKLDPEMNYGE